MKYLPEGVNKPFGRNKCIVLELKQAGKIPFGKHESHEPHFWWYTSYGGGHQLADTYVPDKVFVNGTGYDRAERNVALHECPGI